jgi:AcrR family transcriptional regulator
MASQEERRETTRKAILAAAQRNFGFFGYESVTVDRIAANAEVAKGAVYHHFQTKAELFDAVVQSVAAEILAEVRTILARQSNIWEAMLAGQRAFFATCARPSFAQIFLRDGPSVLGWTRWREIDADHFGGLVRDGLLAAMDLGVIARRPIEPLVGLILGAGTEAAIACANSKNFTETAREYVDGMEAILNGLKPTQP